MEQRVENKDLLFRARLLLEEGQSDRALKILEAIVPADDQQRREVAYLLGWCYILHKRWSDANSVLTSILPVEGDVCEAENQIDRERLALSYMRLGKAAVQFFHYEEATRHYSRCIKLLNDKRVKLSPMVRVNAHCALAGSYMMRGLYDAAIQQYNEAIYHFPLEEEEGEDLANILYGLAYAYRILGQLKDARLAGERALALYNKVGNIKASGITHNLLGQIALENKDYQVASDHFTRALAIGHAHGGPMMALMNCAALAEVRTAEGRLEEARGFCQLACDLVSQVSNGYFCSQAYFTAAKVSHASAEQADGEERCLLLEETISWLEKARSYLKETEAYADAADIFKLWGQTLEELGQYSEALALWRSGYETLSKAKGSTWY